MRFRFAVSILLLSVVLTSCGAAKGTTADTSSTDSNTDTEQEDSDTGTVSTENSQEISVLTSPFSAEALALCGTYYKGGDSSNQMEILATDPEDPDRLYVIIRDSASEQYQSFSLYFTAGTDKWELAMDPYGDFPQGTYTLAKNEDGSYALAYDDTQSISYTSYYSLDTFTMPEIFTRPLNEADLLAMDKEQLSLLRNEFYAAHGRIFTNETLQDYFYDQPWYVPMVESKDFSDIVFNQLEKRNIAFLKAAEEAYDEVVWNENFSEYSGLPSTPYLELLPKNGEIDVEIDSSSAEDMGLFYKASGQIALPVTITRTEYQQLCEGEELVVTLDALTGETAAIHVISTDTEENGPFFEIAFSDSPEYPNDVSFLYHSDTDTYTLWMASDDTIFCKVYEGDIYVLKGACEEYYHHFYEYDTPLKEYPHVYRIMDFNEETNDDYTDYYYGNHPVFDEKGYLKALYFYGD